MPVSVSAFDLTNGAVILRLICGAFFIPHIYFKIFGDPPPALGFFKAAGFKPPVFYMRVAMVVEIVAAVGLLLGIYTHWVALLAAASLFVAGIAVCFANGSVANGSVKWLWNLGGMEFPIFWSIGCLAVALLYWN